MQLIAVRDEVADALAGKRPVVALESTILSHGVPRKQAAALARDMEAAVRAGGAVPATIALVRGQVRVGLSEDDVAEVTAGAPGVAKASVRDLAPLAATGGTAGTTVAATAHVAARCGIPLFATGGVGGVHRGARDTFDVSADLAALARVPTTVVCSGVKSILDIPATLERLESLGIGLLGYRTDAFPAFYLADSGLPVPARADSPAEVAAVVRARAGLGTDASALVVANPLPAAHQLDPDLHDRVLAEGLARLAAAGVTGKDVTPFLLDHFHRETAGASLAANVRLVLANARLAGEIAVALAAAPAARSAPGTAWNTARRLR